MVPVERLEHDGVADPRRGGDCLIEARLRASSPRGAGMPTFSSRLFVRSLSPAMASAMSDVAEVTVAQIRCWWQP
jgi:hypothetical protein